MKKELTARQQEIFDFIQKYVEINGYPPTYREIGTKFEIASTNGVKRHLDALVKKGFMTMESNQGRTLSLVETDLENKQGNLNSFEIPIVGRVAAGYPILAEENIEGTLAIDASLISSKANCFGLKVRGDSMINAGIFEGDLVIVDQGHNVKKGDIVVALLHDEATLKRYDRKDDKIFLVPENQNYSPIEVSNKEDFSIVGKIIGVFRFYN